jgi:hypothetical protein
MISRQLCWHCNSRSSHRTLHLAPGACRQRDEHIQVQALINAALNFNLVLATTARHPLIFPALTLFGLEQFLPTCYVTGTALFLAARERRRRMAFAVACPVGSETMGVPALFDEISACEVFKHRFRNMP